MTDKEVLLEINLGRMKRRAEATEMQVDIERTEAERWRKLAEELAESLDRMVIDKGGWTLSPATRARAEGSLYLYREATKEEK